MAPTEFKEEPLGIKHRKYNELLNEAVKKKTFPDSELTSNLDLQQLLKIDIACKNRDVDYILEAYKSEDMLYVSRAIKKSKWLVTENKYTHIIDLEYLHQNLFPYMTTKAANKLMLSIRLNLKDENRTEQFYKYIIGKNKSSAYKWLQSCTIPFIEEEVKKHAHDIPCHILTRLFKKSISIFEIIVKSDNFHKYQLMDNSQFLVKQNPEKYLDILETKPNLCISFSTHTTEFLIKQCLKRILEKFDFYYDKIHVPTFAKSFKNLDANDFLFEQFKKEKASDFFITRNIDCFLNLIPKEKRFDLVKKIFIEKESVDVEKEHSTNNVAFLCVERFIETTYHSDVFRWYKYAPFDIAFPELKKMIRNELTATARVAILRTLMKSAGQDMKNIHTLLQYYHDEHMNEPFKFKLQFINIFVARFDSHYFPDETWELLIQLFHSVEVFIESDQNVQTCVIAIIVRHVLRGEAIPDIIEKKFQFNTLKKFFNKLQNDEEKEKIFTYLYNYIKGKIDFANVKNKDEYYNTGKRCESLFYLLSDWEKDMGEYPFAIECVKELYKIKREKDWDADLNVLYNINKSWRKFMFEESLTFAPTDQACVNALKHDPSLLIRHKDELKILCINNSTKVTQLLKKVRIYWPNSLGNELRELYFENIDKSKGHKALVAGICTLLPQKELKEFAEKHIPNETKINWKDSDETELSLKKHIAKNLCKARPLVPIDVVLLYAKGDYLQFAVPSLDSVLSQMCVAKLRPRMNHLLEAPISLQKFGIRYIYLKLNCQEVTEIYSQIWKSNKNPTIRTILFKMTHALLCKEDNATNIKVLWELLKVFMDDLSKEESNEIYAIMSQCRKIPQSIKIEYFKKCYNFVKTLPAVAGGDQLPIDMKHQANEVFISLEDDFVIHVMMDKFDENIAENHMHRSNMECLIKFMLYSKDEETQMRRYNALLKPFLDRHLPFWYTSYHGENVIQNNIKEIVRKILHELLNITIKLKLCVPAKMIQEMSKQFEQHLSLTKDYVFITTWKLAAIFVAAMDDNKDVYMDHELIKFDDSNEELFELCEKLHTKMAPQFAKACVKMLLDDCQKSPSIYILYAKAITCLFHLTFSKIFMTNEMSQIYYKDILECSNEKEVHLMMYPVVENCINKTDSNDDVKNLEKIQKLFFNHPSEELKYHYYLVYDEEPQ